MSATIMEQVRALHQENEVIENAIVRELKNKAKTHKEALIQQHKLRKAVEVTQGNAKRLKWIYDDKDSSRKDEISSMSGAGVMSAFYEKLREIRERHTSNPNAPADVPTNGEFDVTDIVSTMFSGEELMGRYFDLVSFHQRFVNLLKEQEMDYLSFLNDIDKFHRVPRGLKDEKYRKYVEDLYDYFKNFLFRVQPLFDVNALLKSADESSKNLWDNKRLPGWEGAANRATSPLYCAACDHLFAKDTVYDAHLKGKKHQKAVKADKKPIEGELCASEARDLGIARTEYRIGRLLEHMREILERTRERAEKRQAQTAEELEEEAQEDGEQLLEEEDSDQEEKPIYNPLNLPLGWDGKPIPFWLYKLHGLNIEYKCEICGDHSYWGRRAFERHFQEWRHSSAMARLKIPNTRHFQEITLIEDAYTLWEKIKNDAMNAWKPEEGEEFEDSTGNVLSKKTYEDLKRQGML